jgi:glutamate dehydrogenase
MRKGPGSIPNTLSTEINEHYAELFRFFTAHPALTDDAGFREVVVTHLPAFIRENRTYRKRVHALPLKIRSAILASEIATSIVYHGGWDVDFEKRLKEYVRRHFIPSVRSR